MLRSVILAAARSGRVKKLAATLPGTRGVVRRFVAGEAADDAVRVTRDLADAGLTVSVDHLGEDTTEAEQAGRMADASIRMVQRLHDEGLADRAELSVKLSALGQLFDEPRALDHAREICAAAKQAGTTVTLDMEDHTTTDSTLDILRQLREDFATTGAVLQAYLRRTEGDCRDLAYAGSRVRLCKGAYNEPESVAYRERHQVDLSYVRCLEILLAGEGYPMIATHDPRLIAIAGDRARWHGRSRGSHEYQMIFGIRPDEQRRLAASGETVRVYVPYGDEWYGYLMRRLAERPANLVFFLRSLVSRT